MRFNRVLGIAASVSDLLSGLIGGMPATLLVLTICAVGVYAGCDHLLEAIPSKGRPRVVDVATLLAERGGSQPFVTVKGRLRGALSWGRHYVRDKSYLPLVGVNGRRALMVQYADHDLVPEESGAVAITGMLERPPAQLAVWLGHPGDQADGLVIDRDHVLVAGADPRLRLWMVITLTSVFLLVVFALVAAKGCVIFETQVSGPARVAVDPSASSFDLHASGTFRFRGHELRLFDLRISRLSLWRTGAVLCANVDASPRVMQVKTEDLAGRWAIVLRSGYVHRVECGNQYLGLRSWPALRMTHGSISTGKFLVTVIRFANSAHFELVGRKLAAALLTDDGKKHRLPRPLQRKPTAHAVMSWRRFRPSL